MAEPRKPHASATTTTANVCAIVRAITSEAALRRCVQSIWAQRVMPKRIVIADAIGIGDDVRLGLFSGSNVAGIDCCYCRVASGDRAAQRRAALSLVNSSVTLFLDDSVTLMPETLVPLVGAFANNRVGAAVIRVEYRDGDRRERIRRGVAEFTQWGRLTSWRLVRPEQAESGGRLYLHAAAHRLDDRAFAVRTSLMRDAAEPRLPSPNAVGAARAMVHGFERRGHLAVVLPIVVQQHRDAFGSAASPFHSRGEIANYLACVRREPSLRTADRMAIGWIVAVRLATHGLLALSGSGTDLRALIGGLRASLATLPGMATCMIRNAFNLRRCSAAARRVRAAVPRKSTQSA